LLSLLAKELTQSPSSPPSSPQIDSHYTDHIFLPTCPYRLVIDSSTLIVVDETEALLTANGGSLPELV
jgi:hypothetical protein